MKNFLNKITTNQKVIALSTGVVASTLAFSTKAFALETLDPAITAGFTSAGAMVALVIGAGVAATVSVVALSGGAKAGLKWIKGVFAKAS